MKYIYKAIIVVSVLIITTNAHAAFMVDWSVDSRPASKLFGKMMMIENTSSGAIPGLYHGIYNLGGEADKTSMWNGLTVSKVDMKALSGEPLIISCYLGGCIILSESNNVVSTSDVGGPFQAAPVPIPAAAWLFMSGLISLVWKGRKARKSFY